jgi:NSS family neurotransmitter:Na+ symporter
MSQGGNKERDSFSSKFGVLAALAGSAIGLGNIWRFPYVVGQNGGGAFLLIYILFIAAIGIPVMMSEFIIGRSAQLNPVGAFKKIAPGTKWHLVGMLGVVSVFIIFSFYTVVAGWTLEYVIQSVRWILFPAKFGFASMDNAALTQFFSGHYESFISGTWRPIIWFVVMMLLTGYIVISGVKNGIEKSTKVLMPIFLVILLVLVFRSVTLEGGREGLVFLFKPDFTQIRAEPFRIILEALGQAFFSLSIGMGTLITYGSYIKKKENLASTAVSVVVADTFVAVLAGIAIFPAVFAFGIDPADGPELVYKTLPVIFQNMPGVFVFCAVMLCGSHLHHLHAGGDRGLLFRTAEHVPQKGNHYITDRRWILWHSLYCFVRCVQHFQCFARPDAASWRFLYRGLYWMDLFKGFDCKRAFK